MKTLLLLAVLAVSRLHAADAPCSGTQHFSNAAVDVRIGYSQTRPPDVPGAGLPLCVVGISVSTTDTQVAAFGLYLCLKLSDGSRVVLKRTVTAICVWGQPTYTEFTLPLLDAGVVPVAVDRFDVTRLYAGSSDTLTSN